MHKNPSAVLQSVGKNKTKCDESRKNYILYSFYKTHCDTRSVGALLTAYVVPQATRVTIKRIVVYYVLYNLLLYYIRKELILIT
jgi:hypothetical protein